MNRSRHYWRNLMLFSLSVMLLGTVSAIVALGYVGAHNYLHPEPLAVTDNPAHYNIPFQNVKLVTSDGLKLAAWYTPPQNGAVILVAHGYSGSRYAPLHAMLAQHGYGVLSWDFRANGESEGQITTLGYYEERDAEAALDYALKQDGVKHVGALGMSMGGVTLIRTAARRSEIEALVSDSAFPAVEEMLDRAVPYPILRPLIRFFAERETGLSASAVRPIDDIGKISPRPVFIIHGSNDTFVGEDAGQRLYNAAGEPRSLWMAPGASHIQAFDLLRDEYTRRVIALFDANLLHKQAPLQ